MRVGGHRVKAEAHSTQPLYSNMPSEPPSEPPSTSPEPPTTGPKKQLLPSMEIATLYSRLPCGKETYLTTAGKIVCPHGVSVKRKTTHTHSVSPKLTCLPDGRRNARRRSCGGSVTKPERAKRGYHRRPAVEVEGAPSAIAKTPTRST